MSDTHLVELPASAVPSFDVLERMHQPVPTRTLTGEPSFTCFGCGQPWPCRTHHVLLTQGPDAAVALHAPTLSEGGSHCLECLAASPCRTWSLSQDSR